MIAAGALISDLGFEWPLAIAQKLVGGPWLVSYYRLAPEDGEECAYEPVYASLPPLAAAMPWQNALL